MSKKRTFEGQVLSSEAEQHILIQLKDDSGISLGPPLDLPVSVTSDKLQQLCHRLLQDDDPPPFSFFVDGEELSDSLQNVLEKTKLFDTEKTVDIIYQPQANFKVRAVTRCTSSIEGHSEAVISVQFSPDGRYLASGSGDTTVRFWDVQTETPSFCCKGHNHWILCISWAPSCGKLASACKNGHIRVWNPSTGKQISRTLSGHTRWVTDLCWQPLHLNGECRLIASASKDTTVRICDTILGRCQVILSGHEQCVSQVRWGVSDHLYTASHDRTVRIWRSNGELSRVLRGHAHWVNSLALSTDYLLRTGAFEPANADEKGYTRPDVKDAESLEKTALKRIANWSKTNAASEQNRETTQSAQVCYERLVSASDDFTLILWRKPTSQLVGGSSQTETDQSKEDKNLIRRLTGHQQPINCIRFSPDGRLLASASFDKSVRLWSGITGKFMATLKGHVGRVYQVAWSADNRLLVSASADSTCKVWSVRTKRLLFDLPGHADEVYAIDWSPDGQRVVSGGKDRQLKVWRS